MEILKTPRGLGLFLGGYAATVVGGLVAGPLVAAGTLGALGIKLSLMELKLEKEQEEAAKRQQEEMEAQAREEAREEAKALREAQLALNPPKEKVRPKVKMTKLKPDRRLLDSLND